MRRFVLHAFVHFLGFEDLLAVGKSDIYTFADGVWAFAFKGENVGQEKLCANVGHGHHRSPRSEYMPPLCTVNHPPVVRSIRAVGEWSGKPLEISERFPEGQDVAVVIKSADGGIIGAARLSGR